MIGCPPKLPVPEALQNQYYKTRTPKGGHMLPLEWVDGEEEFEKEDILAHRFVGERLEYLTRLKSYGPEDNSWLPARNLKNSPEPLQAYHALNPLEDPKAKGSNKLACPDTASRHTRGDGAHTSRHLSSPVDISQSTGDLHLDSLLD
jgi:hypothetical protein